MKILVINGPNLNLLGVREKGIYGSQNYYDLVKEVKEKGKALGAEVEVFQSNSEGELIDKIHSAYGEFDGMVINPGAYTHYSYAIYDAILSVSIPTIEVHISNIHKREEFRRKSVIAPGCIGQVCGLGFKGYGYALEYLVSTINSAQV